MIGVLCAATTVTLLLHLVNTPPTEESIIAQRGVGIGGRGVGIAEKDTGRDATASGIYNTS